MELPPRLRQEVRRVFGQELTAEAVVTRITQDVREEGDAAVLRYNQDVDDSLALALAVPPQEVKAAYQQVDAALVAALRYAAGRIRSFHESQIRHSLASFQANGLGQVVRPLRRVGIYVPGTRVVYPSSVLMTAIPARVAGVGEVVVVTPGGPDGLVSPLKLVACDIAGVHRVFQAGGAQAIAALAYGTETIPRVDKICGPGNSFVTLAKRKVYGAVGIDALYGPSETVVVADDAADPALCAADLLAQAEHDELATPILITTSEALAQAVTSQVEDRLTSLPRADAARAAWEGQGGAVIVDTVAEALALANDFAPEHLCLMVQDAPSWLPRVENAGVVLVGPYSVESVADYTAGPSHVMPTLGNARFASPLGVHDFLKATSVVSLERDAFTELGPPAIAIARAEGLEAHAQAIAARLSSGEAAP
ncbi:MAG: histidinol dehydrogenase [Dehalococcoidia bacterium]